MCLDGLVAVAESWAVQELRRREEHGANVMEDVLNILEVAQVRGYLISKLRMIGRGR